MHLWSEERLIGLLSPGTTETLSLGGLALAKWPPYKMPNA